MNKAAIHHNIQVLLLMAIAFTMPFSIKLNSILIVFCILHGLMVTKILVRLRQALTNPGVGLFIIFFLYHVASLLYSQNKTEAWAIIERRLPLLVFPLLFFVQDKKPDEAKIYAAFCYGISLAGIICIANAFWNYSNTGASLFFYHQLSAAISISAIYLSAYYVFGIMVLLNKPDIIRPVIRIGMIIFFVVLCVLLSSKMLLITLVVYSIVHAFNRIRQAKYKMLSAAIAIILIVGVAQIPPVKERFRLEFSSKFNVVNQPVYNYDTPFTGTTLRLTIWKQCYNIMQKESAWILGVGTGDYQSKLNQQYIGVNMYTGNPQLGDTGYVGYGPHNQYIEVLLYGGIIGLILLVLVFSFQLQLAIKKRNWLFMMFVGLCIVFCISESMLSTNKGIVFYAFFSAFFLRSVSYEEEKA